MARWNFRRLPGALGGISLPHLLALLEPHREFFAANGLSLENRKERFDYEGLLSILVDGQSGTPTELLDAIERIADMSSLQAMDLLLDEAEGRGIEVAGDPDPTPADVAAQVFVLAPDLFAREYANVGRAATRRFVYFQATCDQLLAPLPELPELVTRLELTLDLEFLERRRGCGVRVWAYPVDGRTEFLVRRGGCCKRMPVVDGNRPSSVIVRPERYDIVVFDPTVGELAISADGDADEGTYREIFGNLLFGSGHAFRDPGKFDLSPLKTAGRKALACGDVDGIQTVALAALTWREQGEKSIRTQQGSDLFRETRGLGRSLKNASLLEATFSISYDQCALPRLVKIRPSNVAELPCSADTSFFDDWLTRRGFMRASSHHAADTSAGLARG